MEQRNVYFFGRPGAGNTPRVIKAVKSRVAEGDISKILVASETGRLALEVKRRLPGETIVCVTFDEKTRRTYEKPDLLKKELTAKGIVAVDTERSHLQGG